MRRSFSFWWLCARAAFWGNTAFANDWQWVFGIPVVSGVAAGLLSSSKGATDLSTGYPIFDGFLTALGAFAVTWTVAFIVRLLGTPVRLFHEQKDRADKLAALREPTTPKYSGSLAEKIDPALRGIQTVIQDELLPAIPKYLRQRNISNSLSSIGFFMHGLRPNTPAQILEKLGALSKQQLDNLDGLQKSINDGQAKLTAIGKEYRDYKDQIDAFTVGTSWPLPNAESVFEDYRSALRWLQKLQNSDDKPEPTLFKAHEKAVGSVIVDYQGLLNKALDMIGRQIRDM